METKQIDDATFTLAADEHLIVDYIQTHSVSGCVLVNPRNSYTCHRSIKAARKQAKKANGSVFVCGVYHPKYKVSN